MATSRLKGTPTRKGIKFDPYTRALPQCPDAERVVISYLLKESDLINLVLDILKPSDFGETLHQQIYQACFLLHKDKKRIDPLSVSVWMQDNGIFEKDGDSSINKEDPRITALFEITRDDDSYDFLTYAKRVKEWSSRRKLIQIMRRGLDECYEEDNPQSLIDQVTQNILKVRAADAHELVPLKSCVGAFRQRLLVPQEERAKNAASTGISALDDALNGINPSTITAIVARSSIGKSLMAMQFVWHEATTTDYASIYFLLEMDKELIINRYLQQITGLPVHSMINGKKSMTADDKNKINDALSILEEKNIFLVDEKCNTVSQMRSYLYRFKAKYPNKKIGWIVADHWNLFEGSGDTFQQEKNASEFNDLVKEFKGRGLLPAQCRKPKDGEEAKPPTVYDVKGSGALHEICTNILVLHRPNKGEANNQLGDMANIKIDKARSALGGQKISLWFDPIRISFVDPSTRASKSPNSWAPQLDFYDEDDF